MDEWVWWEVKKDLNCTTRLDGMIWNDEFEKCCW